MRLQDFVLTSPAEGFSVDSKGHQFKNVFPPESGFPMGQFKSEIRAAIVGAYGAVKGHPVESIEHFKLWDRSQSGKEQRYPIPHFRSIGLAKQMPPNCLSTKMAQPRKVTKARDGSQEQDTTERAPRKPGPVGFLLSFDPQNGVPKKIQHPRTPLLIPSLWE